MKDRFFGLAAASAVFLVALALADRALGLVGFPSETPLVVAHAPNFKQVPRNIEYTYTIETNDQGIRYRPLPLKKQPGEHRVAVVGDSYTEGLGIEAERSFPALLEGRFKVPFVNCGRIDSGVTAFGSATDLASALRRAEAAHGEHEKRTGQRDANWPDWYAEYMAAEQSGAELPQ